MIQTIAVIIHNLSILPRSSFKLIPKRLVSQNHFDMK